MGSAGRRVAGKLLKALRSRVDAHLVIVNGENAAGGLGITVPTAAALFDAGADCVTLGNHTFAKRDSGDYFDRERRIIRPANYPPGVPGHGWGIFEAATGDRVVVINLLGRVFMNAVDCPFRTADAILDQMSTEKAIVVDMHAEATSEKVAMGWHLNGRTSAVIGTHTHVPTSDERVLPGGTAYITDAGMTGVRDSVLGLEVNSVIEKFITQIPNKFTLAEGPAILSGVLVEIDPDTGRATAISRILEAE